MIRLGDPSRIYLAEPDGQPLLTPRAHFDILEARNRMVVRATLIRNRRQLDVSLVNHVPVLQINDARPGAVRQHAPLGARVFSCQAKELSA